MALIGLAGVIGGTVITQKSLDRRHREDMEEKHSNDLQELNRKHHEDLSSIRNEYQANFDDIKQSVAELQASVQQYMAITELKIENLTEEVRKHNNFAQRMPVVEEKIRVANHRIDDLERRGTKDDK